MLPFFARSGPDEPDFVPLSVVKITSVLRVRPCWSSALSISPTDQSISSMTSPNSVSVRPLNAGETAIGR